MKVWRRVLVGGGSIVIALGAIAAQEPPNLGALAAEIDEGRKQNHMKMTSYTWNTRTEVKVDGEVKSTKVDLVRFTAEGELQKTKISDSADGQKKPRGIKGKAAGKKIKGMQEWGAELTKLLQKYSLSTAGNLLDYLGKAEVQKTGQVVTLVGRGVVQQGDEMTMLVDTAAKQVKMVEVTTSLDGDAVEMEILNDSLDDGLSFTSRQLVKVPAQKIELTIENFNYQRQ